MTKPKTGEPLWKSTNEAALELGLTPRALRELRATLTHGRHYRLKNPISARPTYVWHVETIAREMDKLYADR